MKSSLYATRFVRSLAVAASLALFAGCGGDAAEEKSAPAAAKSTSKPTSKPAGGPAHPDAAPPTGSQGKAKVSFEATALGELVREQGVREQKSALSNIAPNMPTGGATNDQVATPNEFLKPTDGHAPATLAKADLFVEQPELLVIDYVFTGDRVVNMKAKSEQEMKTLKLRATFELKDGAWAVSKVSQTK